MPSSTKNGPARRTAGLAYLALPYRLPRSGTEQADRLQTAPSAPGVPPAVAARLERQQRRSVFSGRVGLGSKTVYARAIGRKAAT